MGLFSRDKPVTAVVGDNSAALGLVCTGCGYIHEFMGDAVRMYEAR